MPHGKLTIVKCKNCGNMHSAKRIDVKFCSNKCRVTWHNCKPKSLEKRQKLNQDSRKWYRDLKKNNPSLLIFYRTRRVAKKEKIPFNLEPSDIYIPEKCPLLEIPLFFTDNYTSENTPSIDKIIPELGYVKGNIWIISNKANTMKQDVSINQLKKFCQNVLIRL